MLAADQWSRGRFLCVGLDSEFERVSKVLGLTDATPAVTPGRQATFNCALIDATASVAAAYKPNTAFYEARGAEGITDLIETVEYAHTVAPDIPVIVDAKRADIDSTNFGYAEFLFDRVGADAITIHPYLGWRAMTPFLDRADKGVFVLCHTSNVGADEFQELQVIDGEQPAVPLYIAVARAVAGRWNYNGNCGVVLGATFPEQITQARAAIGGLPILIPGVGSQGGDLASAVSAGLNDQKQGIFLNVARQLIFAGEDHPERFAALAAEYASDVDSRICDIVGSL